MRSASSLRRVITTNLIILVIIPLITTILVTYYVMAKDFNRRIAEKNNTMSRLLKNEITVFLNRSVDDAAELGRLIDNRVLHSIGHAERYADTIIRNSGYIKRILITDKTSKVLAVSPANPDLAGNDLSGQMYMSELRRTERLNVISNVFLDDNTGNAVIAVSGRFKDGYVIFIIDISALNGILKTTATGEGLKSMVIDRNGVVIADSGDFDLGFLTNVREYGIRGLEGLKENQTSILKLYDADIMCVQSEIRDTGWKVVIYQYKRSALTSQTAVPFILIMSVAASLLLSFLFGSAFWRNITAALMRLNVTARKMMAGDIVLSEREERYSEIKELTDSFNMMAITIAEREKELREGERYMASLLENLPGTAYRSITHEPWTMIFMSEGVTELTGYLTRELLHDELLSYNDIIYPEDRKMVREEIEKGIREKGFFEIIYRIMTKDGHVKWVFEKGHPAILNGNVFLEGFISDISATKENELKLQKVQKLELIGQLSGGLAHDINNILGGISGAVGLIKIGMAKEDKINAGSFSEYVGIIERSVERAAKIVQELLNISHQREPVMELCTLNASIKDVVSICQNTFDKSVTIRARYSPEDIFVKMDKAQIEQMLLNLCINSLHAMTIMVPEGGKKGGLIEVALEKKRAGADYLRKGLAVKGKYYAVITVGDTGVGIDKADMDKIFDPFFTTKERQNGSGLGLSMVLKIMEMHGGFIDVKSKKGTGSVFKVYIPEAEKPTGENMNPKDSTPEPHNGIGKSILIIDDEMIIRDTAEGILSYYGYKVFKAENGIEGVKTYNRYKDEIDLIVLDMVMPGLSGEMTFRALAESGADVKVVLASGFKKDERVERTLKTGALDFLQKPFDTNSLISMIRKYI